jgi:murein L,D-transpeptidase YcbB/YkuD
MEQFWRRHFGDVTSSMTGHTRCSPVVFLLVLLAVAPGPTTAQSPTIEHTIRLRVEQARLQPTLGVRGARLLQPDAVARFFEAREFAPVWRLPGGAQQMLTAVRNVDQDGLRPADYHLSAITAALDAYTKAPSPETAADLQVLIADAAAALIDHVRYGRVRPSSLDKRWNVDPRVGAPALDVALNELARASAVDVGVEAQKPTHFIYTGLKQALARMRGVASSGGWPAVAAGAAIKPGATDPRVATIRYRLRVTGELAGTASADDTAYDPGLESAVKNFQSHHRLTDDGVIGKATIDAMNITAEARVQQLRVNLERARWVVSGLSDTFVLVNLPAFKAYLIRDRKNVWEARTQIGREARQTPTFRADMKYLVLNPDWTVPPTILAQDVLVGMRKGQNTIARKRLTILDAQGRAVDPATIDWQNATPANFRYTLRQPPGPDNALGRVKFIFPNQHSIFLHDTPSRELFASEQRTFSSGCIRVEHPLDLAAVLLEGQGNWNSTRIQDAVDSTQSQTVFLTTPLPVLIVYWTVSVGATGDLRFAKDVYSLDPAVLRALGDTQPGQSRLSVPGRPGQ